MTERKHVNKTICTGDDLYVVNRIEQRIGDLPGHSI